MIIVVLFPGRTKIKKAILPLIAAAGVKIFAIMPILLGGLSLLVLKALVVGKVALLIAAVLAFQKFFGSGAAGGLGASNNFFKNLQPATSFFDNGASNQAWSSSSAQQQQPQGYYKRSFEDKTAQKLAYSGQAPAETD